MIVDTHQHVLPPFFLEAAYDSLTPMFNSRGRRSKAAEWHVLWTLDEMDEAGIDAALLSLPAAVWTGDVRGSARLARACNEYAAELVKAHSRRLGMFASLPLPDVASSLLEIEVALDDLDADGFVVMSNYQGRWLGDASFEAVLDELDRRGAVVFVHPSAAPRFERALPGLPDAYLEYPFDTTRTIASLLLSGSLQRHRGIRFVFAHFGGAVPMLAERIVRFAERSAAGPGSAPMALLDELRRLHFDTASNSNLPAMAALQALVPPTQILFGSDAPFLATSPTLAGILQAGFDDETKLLIRSCNALGLLPRLRQAIGKPSI